MKNLLAATVLSSGLALASPAHAVLQIAFSDGANTVTCVDQTACDQDVTVGILRTLGQDVGAFHINGTFSTSVSAASNNSLDLSSFTITNTGPVADTLMLIVSDTGFVGPVTQVRESGSLTFHNNVGAGPSTLDFYADANNQQGAGAGLATPGQLLFTASGAATQNPDSFAGTSITPFADNDLFSMTERAQLNLLAGGSVTGFNVSMQATAVSAVPEPSTWAMMLLGFAGLGMATYRRSRKVVSASA